MTPTPLAAAVAPRIGKIIKVYLRVFFKGETIYYKTVYYALYLHFVKLIVRKRVTKFTQTKN